MPDTWLCRHVGAERWLVRRACVACRTRNNNGHDSDNSISKNDSVDNDMDYKANNSTENNEASHDSGLLAQVLTNTFPWVAW